MKPVLLGVLSLLYSMVSVAQLEKKTCLVGGTGSFSSTKDAFNSSIYNQTSKTTEIKISPAVGYFVADNFAVGLKTSFSKYKSKVDGPGGLHTNVNRFELGPFARFYFLPAEKPLNLITEVSHQFGKYSFKDINQKGDINTFSLLAGPVLYFNEAVGLEFLVGYRSRKEDIENGYKQTQKGLQMAIGFQFHLKN